MLRASARNAVGRRTLILGLEPGNFERLKAGQPISFNASDLGVDCDILIFAGESPEEMARQLGAAALDIPTAGSS